MERLELRNRNSEVFFGAPDSLIQAGDPFLQIANFTDQPVTIQKGRLLGWAQNPDGWLDSSTIRTPEEVELLEAHAAAIQAVVHDLLDKPTASPSDQEGGESGELSGGPKTAEVPDPDPIPSSTLLSQINFSPDLTPDQCTKLEAVVLKNADAFGLDGRLGHYDAKVHIPL